MRRAVIAVIALLSVIACDEDKPAGPDPIVCPFAECDPPREKWHVLTNLELAYKNRNITQVDKLLDNNFTFIFAPYDVARGAPPLWGRVDEVSATNALFDTQFDDPDEPRITSLEVTLKDKANLTWVAVVPDAFPEETWYTANVFYEIAVTIYPAGSFSAPSGAKAQFTLRNTGTSQAPHWRIVEWRDLGAPARKGVVELIPETITWGGLKIFRLPGSP